MSRVAAGEANAPTTAPGFETTVTTMSAGFSGRAVTDDRIDRPDRSPGTLPRRRPEDRGRAIVRRTALTMCGALAVALVCGAASQSLAAMQTTRTTYQYNADHALTAVTTTVDGESSTVYFTWDNCVVSTGDPTSCTLSAGNGNLLGIGSAPGSNYTTQFTFDQRNRLTSATPSGAETVSYTYHPASLMATAAIGNTDSLAFTYDVSSLPQVANIQQSSTGKW